MCTLLKCFTWRRMNEWNVLSETITFGVLSERMETLELDGYHQLGQVSNQSV